MPFFQLLSRRYEHAASIIKCNEASTSRARPSATRSWPARWSTVQCIAANRKHVGQQLSPPGTSRIGLTTPPRPRNRTASERWPPRPKVVAPLPVSGCHSREASQFWSPLIMSFIRCSLKNERAFGLSRLPRKPGPAQSPLSMVHLHPSRGGSRLGGPLPIREFLWELGTDLSVLSRFKGLWTPASVRPVQESTVTRGPP